MLGYFRLNDPFRVITVLVILLIIKLPLFINGGAVTIQELNWMLLGERLSQGKLIYSQVIDNTAPLAGLVYWLIHLLFGKSWLAYHLLAMILICIQGFYINLAFNQTRVFNEKTFVPLLIYALFMSISFDMSTLSPVLMSVTFLAIGLKNVLYLDSQSPVQMLFSTGFILGIATLFYLPAIIFLPTSILCFVLFRTSSIKSLLNIFSGFLLAVVLAFLFFIFSGNIGEFYRYFVQSIVLSKTWVYNFNQLLVLFSFPTILLVFSILKLKTSRGFINYQQNSHWLIIIWTIFTLIALLLSPKISSISFIIFAPVFAFFISQFLLLQKNKIIGEIYLILIFAAILGTAYYSFSGVNTDGHFYSNVTIKQEDTNQNERIMVLGNNINAYYKNTIASPFLNWKISARYLGKLDRYSVIKFVKNNIVEDKPKLIIDYSPEKISKTIFEQIPLLYDYYTPLTEKDMIVYERKEENQILETAN